MPLFSTLLDFIQHRMRMSHIYQPVMLTTLIRGGGTASVKEIASQFAQRDAALASMRETLEAKLKADGVRMAYAAWIVTAER